MHERGGIPQLDIYLKSKRDSALRNSAVLRALHGNAGLILRCPRLRLAFPPLPQQLKSPQPPARTQDFIKCVCVGGGGSTAPEPKGPFSRLRELWQREVPFVT